MSISLEIRRVLAESDQPLSVGDIRARLTVECQNLPSALRERVLAGEFTRHHSTAGLRYSLNPQWSPRKKGAPPALPKSKAAKLLTSATKVDVPNATEAEVDLNDHRTELGKANPGDCRTMAAPPRPSDFDLRRRLDAIGTDIADAIADACDAKHPHALIKALVVSREAVSRAQQALPVS